MSKNPSPNKSKPAYPVILRILGFKSAPHFVGKYMKILATIVAPPGYHRVAAIFFVQKQPLTQPMDPEKKSLNFIFPTKYVIPKSLKFSHWPSKTNKKLPSWITNFHPFLAPQQGRS